MDIHTLLEHTAHRSHLDSLGVLHCTRSPESPHTELKMTMKADRESRAAPTDDSGREHKGTEITDQTGDTRVMTITRCPHYLVSRFQLLFLGFCQLLSE